MEEQKKSLIRLWKTQIVCFAAVNHLQVNTFRYTCQEKRPKKEPAWQHAGFSFRKVFIITCTFSAEIL